MVLSPEWQLLLACASTPRTPDDRQRVAHDLIQPGFDWDRLIARACYHGVASLLYDHLQAMGLAHALPAEAMARLQRVYYATAARNARLYQVLGQVLGALQAGGVQVIVLKGAALAELVYPHRALRPMSDVDVLVRTTALARAEDILLQLGYTFDPQPRTRAWFTAHHFHLPFHRLEATPLDVMFELHWHLEPPESPFQIDLEGLWDRAVSATIGRMDTLVLAPEDQLLHLCLHTCRHAAAPMRGSVLNFRLRSCCDLAATIRHDGPLIDWGALAQRAQRWRVRPYVYLPLQLARDLVGAAVPPPALAALQPEGFDPRLLGWARAELLQDLDTWPLFPALLTLWKGSSFKDRATVVANILSPARIAQSYAMPPASKTIALYYPVRLKDLLVRYGPVLWRLLGHDRQLRAVAAGKVHLAAWLALGWRRRR